MRVTLAYTGDTDIDYMLNQLGSKPLMRRAVNPAAKFAMRPILKHTKTNNRRTSARGKSRPPKGSVIGPSSRFVTTRVISAKSQNIGAMVRYDTRKFPGFVVANKAGTRYFYPAAQEYGAPTARPPIKPKQAMRMAMLGGANAAFTAFRVRFEQEYAKVVQSVKAKAKRGGGTRVL